MPISYAQVEQTLLSETCRDTHMPRIRFRATAQSHLRSLLCRIATVAVLTRVIRVLTILGPMQWLLIQICLEFVLVSCNPRRELDHNTTAFAESPVVIRFPIHACGFDLAT